MGEALAVTLTLPQTQSLGFPPRRKGTIVALPKHLVFPVDATNSCLGDQAVHGNRGGSDTAWQTRLHPDFRVTETD